MPDDIVTVEQLAQLSVNNYVQSLKDQLQRVVYARSEAAFAAGDAARDAICTPQALRRRQRKIRATLLDCIGGLPSLQTPLNVKVAGRVEEKGFDIENLVYESRPKTYVTANLYVPHGITKPRGAVLLLCGHDGEGKQAYHTVCVPLVRAGLVVMVQDPMPGFADGVRARLYNQEGCRAFVFPGILAYCDLPDLRKWRKARG